MIIGAIKHPDTYKNTLTHPIWEQALGWIRENLEKPDGEYEIMGRDIYASVQTITTIPRTRGIFEAHREYIDLHFCITGSEAIEWAPVDTLTLKEDFNTEKDYGLYGVPSSATSLLLTPGTFACFYPADAHMPKIQSGSDDEIKKIVVKIRKSLLV